MKKHNQQPTKVKALYVHISDKKVETTQELFDGQVYVDFDAEGKVRGFEFINPLKLEVDGEIQ